MDAMTAFLEPDEKRKSKYSILASARKE